MSKSRYRVDNLRRKTHTFISGNIFRLLREYTKAKLEDENVPTNEYQDELNEIKRLWNVYLSDGTPSSLEAWKQLVLRSKPVAYSAFRHERDIKMCERFPLGLWVLKDQGKKLREMVSKAEQYLARKK